MATTTNENLISNLSYTEKDFQVIYPALLDLAKKLTSKWDPSASNESDPGVILLKLNALIADKCNYNIDKNILECFPLSVTQETNARQLFEQLGYYMHWYTGAETTVTLKYIGDDAATVLGDTVYSYDIPIFTMVSDSEKAIIYTIVDQKALKNNGEVQNFRAIQGVAKQYTINDSTVITTAHLDSNNRLYFDDTDVAENGIFINNVDQNNYTSWIKKDNLLLENLSGSNFYYKFGVSQDLSTCYLEFPENAEELFQSGINITYIKTSGLEGNISFRTLDSFYADLTVEDPAKEGEEDNTKALTTDNVAINNYVVGSGGDDPETINDAYLGYKKTVSTFNTLITLRDYINAIRKSQYLSNAIVADRTSDPQTSYKIMTESGSLSQQINEVALSSKDTVYGYFSGDTETGAGDFYEDAEHTLFITPDASKNYVDKTSLPWSSKRVVFRDGISYYISADLVEIPAMGAFDLKLFLLSTTAVITEPDSFNKTFDLNLNSTTSYFVELELEDTKCIQHNFVDILPTINDDSSFESRLCLIKNKYPVSCKIVPQYSLTEDEADNLAETVRKALYSAFNAKKLTFGEEISYDNIYDTILNADPRIKSILLEPLSYRTYVVYADGDEADVPDNYEVTELDITDPAIITDSTTGEKIIDPDSLINKFRTEIYAKSVLAGNTQFFVKDTTFDFGINQRYQLLENTIGRLDTNVTIKFNEKNDWTYVIRENETVQLYAPNLLDYATYSSNVRYEYYIPKKDVTSETEEAIIANSSYMLKDGEFIAFYYVSDANDSDSGFDYTVYGKGTVIKPSYNLYKNTDKTSLVFSQYKLEPDSTNYKIINNQKFLIKNGNTVNEPSSTKLAAAIKALTGSENLLSGNRSINIELKNTVTLNNSNCSCYWILNEKKNNKYYLFDDTTDKPRILQSGEYFMYTNPDKSDLNILGAGTQISRGSSLNTYCVDAIDYSEIVENGILALTDYWTPIISGDQFDITEMQYTVFTDGVTLQIKPMEGTDEIILNSKDAKVITNCNIKYKVANSSDWVTLPNVMLDDGSSSISEFTWRGITTLKLNVSSTTAQTLVAGQTISYYYYDLVNKQVIIPEDLDDQTIDPTKDPWLLEKTFSDNIKYEAYLKTTVAANATYTLGSEEYLLFYWKEDTEDDRYNYYLFTEGSSIKPSFKFSSTQTSAEELKGYVLLQRNISKLISEHYVSGRTLESDTQLNADIDALTTVLSSTKTAYITTAGVTYLMSSKLLNCAGGNNISTITYDYNKNIVTLDIYAYVLGTMDNNINYLSDGSTEIIYLDSAEQEQIKKITFKLPGGNYIMPVYHATEDKVISELQIAIQDDPTKVDQGWSAARVLTPMGSGSNNLYLAGNYYLRIDNLTDHKSEKNFFITIFVRMKYRVAPGSAETAPVVSVVIPPIFKYSDSDALSEEASINASQFKLIAEKIKELDYHNLFNYTYVIDEDKEIANPLASAAYLDTNHIMNPYTICQLDTDTTSIYITDKIRN